MKQKFILFFLFIFSASVVKAQTSPGDSTQVNILEGTQRQMFKRLPDGTELLILAGNVRLKQGTALFYCDSCIVNEKTNVFEAFGNVHINDSDTAHVYANYLRYLTDKRIAYLKGSVKLTDGQGTLITNELEYDMASRIGTYFNGGTVLNKKSVLTSREGVYYADLRDIYFKGNVELKDPAYNLKSDSLIYNTESQIARFIAETFIRDSSNRTIRTEEGFYDLRYGRAEFTQRTTIIDGDMFIEGNEIASDDSSGISQIRGNGVLIDKKQGVSILANEIFANKKTEAYLATRKPLMIIKQDKDSIYITADTLYSARLTDLLKIPDSLQKISQEEIKVSEKDSTNRYFEAFKNVRVFSDSVQTVSDSLFYSFKDSVFQLYKDPVVWNNKNQIMGDTIFLYTKNKKASRIKVFENSFLISEAGQNIYNQVRSSRMDGFFKEGKIDSVRARGAAESVYYVQDSDSAYTGINQTSSDIMDVFFANGDLNKVVFRSSIKGTLWPISQKTSEEVQLKGFQWLESRRPKTKYELFE
ncbi:MAG: OstA-like protein [Chitinophagaceae bacterium]